MRRVLAGRAIRGVEVVRDTLVFGPHSPRAIERALLGRTVRDVGRRGKSFWIGFDDDGPTLYGHLGMSGWVREVGRTGTRLRGHGDAPFDDAQGRPRFLRLRIESEGGRAVAFTDPRRLGRIWLGAGPDTERRVARLGPDAYDALPDVEALVGVFGRRKGPIKAVLLDQTVLAGIGNWIADEVLYQSRIAPARLASSLSRAEVKALRKAIQQVLTHAVRVGADHRKFPRSWLFAHRWGGGRGATRVGRQTLVRTVVGGRTTAWVPGRQR
jgi:formamidopyrimidine-DNA glycosylase